MRVPVCYTIPLGSPTRYCKGCRQPIFWLETARRSKMPVNPDGSPHRVTCRVAQQFKKTKGPAA